MSMMNLNLRKTLLVMFMSSAATLSFAQSAITGHVKDEHGDPVIGASFLLADKAAAVTDLDGNFTIKATPSAVVKVSYVGYKTSTLNVTGGQSNLSIAL
ncbi:MAG TPA: hypothetical protein DCS83_00740, partial [Prevotella sp.]|nr:hypothetical protein [Prevotella sp.]